MLAENSRMKFLPLVARAFNKTMAFSRGEVNVTITAASPFDAESKKALDEILQNFAPGFNQNFLLLNSLITNIFFF